MWLKKKSQNASAVVEESLKVGWEGEFCTTLVIHCQPFTALEGRLCKSFNYYKVWDSHSRPVAPKPVWCPELCREFFKKSDFRFPPGKVWFSRSEWAMFLRKNILFFSHSLLLCIFQQTGKISVDNLRGNGGFLISFSSRGRGSP